MPDKRNALEILQKALHWMMVFHESMEKDDLDKPVLEQDVAGLKSLLANMPTEEKNFLVNVPQHILTDMSYNMLHELVDNTSLANRAEIDLDDVRQAELLVQIIKGVAVKADNIVLKLHKEEGEHDATSGI